MTDSKNIATGGCLCGGTRYEAVPRPDSAYYCHCRDCQIGSGSAFHAAIFCDEDDFRQLSGNLSTYETVADSGRALKRNFCTDCGTPLYWTGEGFPGAVVITLSSLDDPEAHQPVHEGWTARSLSWARISDDIESFPKRPDRGDGIE